MDTHEPIETIEARQQRLATVPRACEGCRVRKIRCDRTIPCSHCRSSGISCQNTSDKPTSRSRSDRVRQLESHVSHLEKRLRTLEGKLSRSHSGTETQRPSSKPERTPIDIEVLPAAGENQLFEGGSSFNFQSMQANEIVGRTASPGDRSSLKDSVDSLQTILQDMSSCDQHSFKHSSQKQIATGKPLPPALVIGILRRFKTRRPIFLSSYAVSDLALVERLCRDTYFPMGQITVGQVTSMHGILFSLMKEYKAMDDPISYEYDLTAYISQCEENFILGLETYDVLSVPSFENILGLVMGSLKAQEEGKPFLYCTLISSASTHCQTLGYHRESTYKRMDVKDADNRRRLFWTVYAFDKNICLLLGRASHIQDFEIDTEYPTASSDPLLRAWDESFILGIKLASVQGQIYTSLYSAAGMKRSISDRSADIERLATDLEQWRIDLKGINSQGVNNAQVFDLSRGNWDITFYSTLTALFRVSPDPTGVTEISSQCFSAARLSLKSHLRCLPKYQESELLSDNDYINFVLLFASFTPFIVTFLHAIATNNSEDVKLLNDVVSTLKNIQSASNSTARLYKICSTYLQIAKKLTEPQRTPMGIYDLQEDCLRWNNEQGHSFIDPDILRSDFTSHENTGELSSSSALNILDDWISGQPLPMDFFDMDLEMNNIS